MAKSQWLTEKASKLAGVITDEFLVEALIRFIQEDADADHLATVAEACFGGRIIARGDATYSVYEGNFYMGALNKYMDEKEEE